jgi:hypothetical protein
MAASTDNFGYTLVQPQFILPLYTHAAHLASYPMGTRGSFPGGKAAGA